jgi:hypothetical protein
MDMNGALMKASTRFAIAAALGLALGAGSARAADLGGNCCADLEERVAELEATTARKGNRKMSLTITGQVNRMVLWWNDGDRSDTYYGLDNTNSSSRFTLLGEAKISPRWKSGFEIMIEIEAGGTSSKVSQWDEDGKVGTQINGTGAASFNASNVDAYFGDARRAVWWIEDKDLGRMTVGRYESAGVVTTIDLGGISVVASSSTGLINGGFSIRGPTGQYYTMLWSGIGDPASAQGRTELVRWDSPTWHGFTTTSSIAEAGDYWGSMVRYANEFSGFRVAAGIGYERITDRQTTAAGTATVGPTDLTAAKPKITAWGGSLAALHVPTGLFAQGHYLAADFNGANLGISQYWGQSVANKQDSHQWMIQAGITKNWFGIGNTAIYGEYSRSDDWGAGLGAGRNYTSTVGTGFTDIFGVTGTELTVWGLGLVQNVDAAATELYLGYRHFEADISCSSTVLNCAGAAGATVNSLNTEAFHAVAGGARIKF